MAKGNGLMGTQSKGAYPSLGDLKDEGALETRRKKRESLRPQKVWNLRGREAWWAAPQGDIDQILLLRQVLLPVLCL